MKKLFTKFIHCLLLITALGGAALSAQAQTITNTPVLPSNPFSTILGYFTGFNTNLDDCFAKNRFLLWSGVSSIQGGTTPLVNSIGLSYDVWRPTPADTNSTTFTALSLDAQAQNSGVAGTLTGFQFGPGFSVIIHDVRAGIYIEPGYELAQGKTKASFYGEAGVRVFKAIGHNFYMGVGIGARFPKNSQVISGFIGATF